MQRCMNSVSNLLLVPGSVGLRRTKLWPRATSISQNREMVGRGMYILARFSDKETRESSPSGDREDTTSPAPLGMERPFPFVPITALAILGLVETAYLTVTKIIGGAIVCPLSGGCASVLTSEYATLWGVFPLSAAGMLAYGGVAALAFMGFLAVHETASDAETGLRMAVLVGGLLLGTTSTYLMYILVTAFPGETCPWCIGSAALSAGIVALSATGMKRRELEEAAVPGVGIAAATLLALSLGLGTPDASVAGTGITELDYKQPLITAESSKEAMVLAQRLRDAGAKMYGAFWCSHCYEQKQEFGKGAMDVFPYVECFPEGWKQGIEMDPACKEANLEGFPTWVIGSERLEGEQPLEVLQSALDKTSAGNTKQ